MTQSIRIILPEEICYLKDVSGRLSNVHLGAWTDSEKEGFEQLAIKSFRGAHLNEPERRSSFIRRLYNEVSIWQRIQPHPNVLPFLGVFCKSETSVPALITPFRPTGNISVFLRKRPDANRRDLSVGVVTGLAHLHHQDIVHGNLKPSNILIHLDDSGSVIPQISDFGQTKILSAEGYTEYVDGSSCRYIAPEILRESHLMAFTRESDIYSLGMLLLEILSDTPPYLDLGESQMKFVPVRNEEPDFNTHNSAVRPMSWVWGFLRRCWMFGTRPQDRCTAEECLNNLRALIPKSTVSQPPQIVREPLQMLGTNNIYFKFGPPALKILDVTASSAKVADLSTRYPPPLCYPGTRTTLIDRARKWILDDRRAWNILWLYGPAGVGKSAFAQTIAQFAQERCRLGAVFSFSRLNGCDDFHHVFIMLAYQLATHVPGYLSLVSEQLAADPDLVTKPFQVQFRRLIIGPLRSCPRQPKYLIILDGLSECNGVQLQLDIIELIHNSTLSPASLPVIWMICSRPEPHIVQTFASADLVIPCWREALEVDAQESREDAARFIRARFQEIHENNRDPFDEDSNGPWLSEDGVAHIVDAVSGLFVLADTILKYVEDPELRQPSSRLTSVLTLIWDSHVIGRNSPMEILDLMYTQILSEVAENIWPETRRLLRIATDQGSALGSNTPQLLYNFMGISGGQFYAALEGLHSVLDVPLPQDADNRPIRFLHTSFIEYLLNPDRSDQFCIALSPTLEGSDEMQRSSLRFIGSMIAFLVKNALGSKHETSELDQRQANQILSDCLPWPSPDPALNWEFACVLSHVACANIFGSYSNSRIHENHQGLINELRSFDFNALAFTLHGADPIYRELPQFICWTKQTSLDGLVRTHSTSEADDKLLSCLNSPEINAEPLNMDIILARKSFDWLPQSAYFLMGYGTSTVLVLVERGVGQMHSKIKYHSAKTALEIWPSLAGLNIRSNAMATSLSSPETHEARAEVDIGDWAPFRGEGVNSINFASEFGHRVPGHSSTFPFHGTRQILLPRNPVMTGGAATDRPIMMDDPAVVIALVSGSGGAHEARVEASIEDKTTSAEKGKNSATSSLEQTQSYMSPFHGEGADEGTSANQSIGQPIVFATGHLAGRTVHIELKELQKAKSGGKYSKVDRQPLDPPPVLLLSYIQHLGADGRLERELGNYEEVKRISLECRIDLFPVPDKVLDEKIPVPPSTKASNIPDFTASSPLQSSSSTMPSHVPLAQDSRFGLTSTGALELVYSSSINPDGSSLTYYQFHPYTAPIIGDRSSPQRVPHRNLWRHPALVQLNEAKPPPDIILRIGNHMVTESSRLSHVLAGEVCRDPALIDYMGKKCLVFAFGNLAVRREGTFILRYQIFDSYPPMFASEGRSMLAELYGGPFRVYSTREFPGFEPSTGLTRILSKNGVRVVLHDAE